MTKREPPSKEAFDKLLLWLDADGEKAAERYQQIQFRLIRIFAAKGCSDAEDLVDEAFNVVALKIDWLLANYVGDPARYIHAVAKKLFLERLKQKPLSNIPPSPPDNTEIERRCACLERCFTTEVTLEERSLVLEYHAREKQEKIRKRKELAQELGISMNALRIRVFHIHARLRPCIEECLRQFEDQ